MKKIVAGILFSVGLASLGLAYEAFSPQREFSLKEKVHLVFGGLALFTLTGIGGCIALREPAKQQ